jgi:dimethylhistidine N-methyltransferase
MLNPSLLNPSLRPLLEANTSAADQFATEVLQGLSRPSKTLPCRFFYDARGSELFERITRLPEYYPTRAETAILKAHAEEIAGSVPDGGVLVEFGSGSSLKTEILLERLPRLGAYVPIDVSQSALADAKRRLAARFPWLDVRPIMANFAYPVALPAELAWRHKTGFFPGSTIGNLMPVEASRLLRVFRAVLSSGGRLIVGIDLKKDAGRLVRAYDDSAGVTAAFNLNLLVRINRELGANFDLRAFKHKAIYNACDGRIEMHIVSLREQSVRIRGRRIYFRAGESIHTENSYKYSIPQFQDLARSANWQPTRVWTDPRGLFSVHELTSV